MRTLIHLSDLHFGRVDVALVEPVIAFVAATKPDLVVVSGDFTHRARTAEFLAAKQFLSRISVPILVVPGNHDIPLDNLVARFAWPLARYRKYLCSDLSPFFSDDEIAVAGINTARSLTTKYGRINAEQLAELTARFGRVGKAVTRIVVTHHPFDLPVGYVERRQLVGRSQTAMTALAANGVDLLLSGHLHLTHTGLSGVRYNIAGHSALVVVAGTALSTRGRGEANSFNVLRIEPGKVLIERILWDAERRDLSLAVASGFTRSSTGWEKQTEVRGSTSAAESEDQLTSGKKVPPS